jgi:Family of unknown function (DUF6152)
MRRVVSVMLVAAVVLLVGAASYAHHSYASTYDVRQEVTLKGKLVQFVYRNPHTFVHVQAPDENGQMQRWAVEWGGTTQLDRSGVTRDTLKVGDDVVIVARPSRVQGEYRALMVKLTRPSDGFTWGTRQGEAVD